jgi:hypothetical protein
MLGKVLQALEGVLRHLLRKPKPRTRVVRAVALPPTSIVSLLSIGIFQSTCCTVLRWYPPG